MDKSEVVKYILQSDIINKWHWFNYHFQFYKFGIEHPFAKSIIDAILNIEKKIDGYSVSTINRMAGLAGKGKYEPHYEQLLQICSEIYVINQASSGSPWKSWPPRSLTRTSKKSAPASPRWRKNII